MNERTEKSAGSKPETRNCTEELLEELHKNVTMGKQSLTDIMPKVKNAELSSELTCQFNEYDKFCDSITEMLKRFGGQTKTQGFMTKMSAKLGIEMNTLTDSSDAHIAQMIIEGTTMGITETIRLVRDYENSNCSEEALELARKLVSYQEKIVEDMKRFL